MRSVFIGIVVLALVCASVIVNAQETTKKSENEIVEELANGPSNKAGAEHAMVAQFAHEAANRAHSSAKDFVKIATLAKNNAIKHAKAHRNRVQLENKSIQPSLIESQTPDHFISALNKNINSAPPAGPHAHTHGNIARYAHHASKRAKNSAKDLHKVAKLAKANALKHAEAHRKRKHKKTEQQQSSSDHVFIEEEPKSCKLTPELQASLSALIKKSGNISLKLRRWFVADKSNESAWHLRHKSEFNNCFGGTSHSVRKAVIKAAKARVGRLKELSVVSSSAELEGLQFNKFKSSPKHTKHVEDYDDDHGDEEWGTSEASPEATL